MSLMKKYMITILSQLKQKICSTCGLLYCERCGKVVNDTINEPKLEAAAKRD
jgi:hypothetical protein